MRVLVAGGGIGGLTTAIALRHQGIDALVLEQAPVLTEIGAGIQIAANAAIVLRELGLEAGMRAMGTELSRADRGDIAAGTRADDDDVERCVGHVGSRSTGCRRTASAAP